MITSALFPHAAKWTGRRCLQALVALALSCSVLHAQQNGLRIRGTITAFEGALLSVSSPGSGIVGIELAPDASIVTTRLITFADLKPGMALGATAVKRADGKLVASEVHVFPPGNGIPNEGNRPMERGEPGATMTNATVSAVVQGRAGREMTLTYEGGMQQVVVPENVPVTLPVAGDRSLLVPGSSVSVLATVGAGNRLTSSRVQLGR